MGLEAQVIIVEYNYNTKLAIPSFLSENAKERYTFKGVGPFFGSLDE